MKRRTFIAAVSGASALVATAGVKAAGESDGPYAIVRLAFGNIDPAQPGEFLFSLSYFVQDSNGVTLGGNSIGAHVAPGAEEHMYDTLAKIVVENAASRGVEVDIRDVFFTGEVFRGH